tara:strand:- start:5404 stop:6204 length:801 start_codon:yes stop_codon:yes gene_type:complete
MFFVAQIKKDFLWDFSYKISFFGQFFGIILTVFTFFFISRTFEDSTSTFLQEYGNNYFLFAIIGISLADLITLSLRSATKSIREAQAFGYIDSLINSKINPAHLVLCSMLYPCIIGIIKIFLYFLTAKLFYDFQLSAFSSLIVIILSIFTLFSFLGLGFIAASFVLYFKQGDPINFLISLVASALSGVLFPVSVLPEYLRNISELIPLTYGLDMIRKVVIYNSFENIDLQDLTFMGVFSLIFLIGGILIIKRTIYAIKLKGISGSY